MIQNPILYEIERDGDGDGYGFMMKERDIVICLTIYHLISHLWLGLDDHYAKIE